MKWARRRTHDGGEEGAERGEEVGGGRSSGDGQEEEHQRGAAGESSHIGFLISLSILLQPQVAH